MSRVLLFERDDRDSIRAAFRRQIEIDDLGILLLQQRHEYFIERHAEYRGLVGRLAGIRRVVDRFATQRHALDREHGKTLNLVVVSGVIAERTFGGGFVAGCVVGIGLDEPLEHDFRRSGHLQIMRQAVDDLRARTTEKSGELIFGQRIGHRRYGAENRRRICTERDDQRKRRAGIRRGVVAKIQRASAHAQPTHDHLVARNHLLPIDAEILTFLVRTARHRESPRDQRRHVAGPACLDR